MLLLDISMEMHSDIFEAASMVGEAMQSLVTAVSRQGGKEDVISSGTIGTKTVPYC